MTSNTIQPADQEMHMILNQAYEDAKGLIEVNMAAFDAIVAALLEQPGAAPSGSEESLETSDGTSMQAEDVDLGGGTVSGDEIRRIVQELGDEDCLEWRDLERQEFM